MNENIYTSPQANLEIEESGQGIELASRRARLYAAIIDAVIGFLYSIPFIYLVGPAFGYNYIRGQHHQPNIQFLLVSSIFYFVMFSLIHGYYLRRYGQTMGKKLLSIGIVTTSNENASLFRILGLRYFPVFFFPLIPIFGGIFTILDILIIFRGNRRCLHDLIAGTCVVQYKIKNIRKY